MANARNNQTKLAQSLLGSNNRLKLFFNSPQNSRSKKQVFRMKKQQQLTIITSQIRPLSGDAVCSVMGVAESEGYSHLISKKALL